MESLSKKELRKKKKVDKMSALLAVAALNEREKKIKEESLSDQEKIPPKKMKLEDAEDEENRSESQDDNYIVSPDKNYDELKTEIRQLKAHRVHPQFQLRTAGEQASLSMTADDRVPILFTDLQHLLLTTLLGEDSPYKPSRWCNLKKIGRISNTVMLVVEDASLYHYVANESIFTNSKSIFSNKLEVVTPALYGGSVVDELAVVPLSEAEKQCLIKEHGSLDAAMEARKDLMVMMKAVFPIADGGRPKSPSDDLAGDKFSRTQLVLSAWQLIEENYPLPLKGKLQNTYAKYLMTKDTYSPVTSKSPMFGLDCEMCQTTAGSELTRISVVDEKLNIIYEKFVLPHNKITNYLTQFSGIKAKDLENVKTRIEDVQRDLRNILPSDAILVGQSLNFDLHALKMMHPYVIDTSVVFNLSGQRARKSKLRQLAKQLLKEDIQESAEGHCSIEDAKTVIKLVQLKLSQEISFGDAVLRGKENYYKSLQSSKVVEKEYTTNIFSEVAKNKKSLAILGDECTLEKYDNYLKKIVSVDENRIETRRLECNNSIVKDCSELCLEKDLVISHIKLDSDNTCRPKALKHIDRFIKKIWKSVKIDSFVIVLFTGDKSCNGVAFIGIKNVHVKL